MKYLPHLLSFIALFLVVAKIRYDEDARSDHASAASAAPQRVESMTVVAYPVPDHLQFAGENVPLDVPDVRERLDKELQINSYWHNNTIFLIKRANRWLPQMTEILRVQGIPDDFKYLPVIESALLNDVSPKNASGFWQIAKASGRELGLEVDGEVDQRFDPILSTEAACKYLKKAHDRFGSWTLVAASYNRGMNGLERAIEQQHVNSYYDLYLNEETSRYVFRILACKLILEDPQQYGFFIKPNQLYQKEQVRYVDETETIRDLAVYAKEKGINYKLLKRFNPWLRDDKLTIRSGHTYRIALPDEPPK